MIYFMRTESDTILVKINNETKAILIKKCFNRVTNKRKNNYLNMKMEDV